jgi:tRNA(Glu) U13 pseudouridine synthase TruD
VAHDLDAALIAQRCSRLNVRAPSSCSSARAHQLHLKQDVSVGCFRRVAQPAALGDSLGNHFRITLRRCLPSAQAVHERLLRCSNGQFINYFGVQRVGDTACVLQRCHATGAWACVDVADLYI